MSQEPQFVFWYHNERMINYDAGDQERIQVLTQSSSSSSAVAAAVVAVATSETSNESVGADHVFSHLTIRNVTDADSGNYSCVPSNAEPASTMVYVSEGNFLYACNYHNPFIYFIFSFIFNLFSLLHTPHSLLFILL